MQQRAIVKAALWMAGWLAMMLAMSVAGKEVTKELDVFQVMVVRTAMGLMFLAPVMTARGFAPARTRQFRLHLARNLVHYAAQYAWLLALSLIPLAQVVSIEFTFPIWTAILATIFLGERLSRLRIAAIVIGFAGVLVIVRPGLTAVELGQVVALLAALGFGGSTTLTKALTRSETALTVIFYMMAIQFVLGLVPGLMVWQWPSLTGWGWLAVIGVTGTFSHYCFTSAMVHADASVVAPMDFLRVPLSALIGWLVFSETADVYLAAGAVLILAGNAFNLTPGATSRSGLGKPAGE